MQKYLLNNAKCSCAAQEDTSVFACIIISVHLQLQERLFK